MRSNPCLAALMILALGACAAAQTSERGSSHESLRGLGQVAVVVEQSATELRVVGTEPDTPAPADVKAGVEEQLRAGGIRVADAAKQGDAGAALHLSLVAHKDERGYNHFVLRLWLTQQVVLPRPTPVRLVASTWDVTGMAFGAGYQLFERAICGRVHDFISAYRAANSLDPPPPLSNFPLPPMSYDGACPLAKKR